MKVFLVLMSLLSVQQLVVAQKATLPPQGSTAPFHRLLIVNENNELLVAKVGERNFLVTPGFYQDNLTTFSEGLDKLAAEYNLPLNNPELKGVFSLRRKTDKENSVSVRLVYRVDVDLQGQQLTTPAGVKELRWVNFEEVSRSGMMPHIVAMIKQVNSDPNVIWGGTLLQTTNSDGTPRVQVEGEFYRLGDCREH